MASKKSKKQAPKPLMGKQEARVFTKPLRRLTRSTTLGYLFIDFCDMIGIKLYPWQAWLALHALELAPGVTVKNMHKRADDKPLFRFRTVVVLVARQNGKTTVMTAMALFFLYVLQRKLILSTAQDLSMARDTWQSGIDVVNEVDALQEEVAFIRTANSQETFGLKSGGRWIVKPPNRRAVRGRAADLVLVDELREHQTWVGWAAISKTVMARPDAQIWGLSNAGDEQSVVLAKLRDIAHELLDDPDGILASQREVIEGDVVLTLGDEELPGEVKEDDDQLELDVSSFGWFEWSSAPDLRPFDRKGWAQANPALGHGMLSERSLAAAATSDPLPVFQAECLCRFPSGRLDGLFPPGSWEDQVDPGSEVGSGERIVCSVAVASDRSRAVVGIAGYRDDGLVHLGIIAARAGTEWVVPFLTGRIQDVEPPPFECVVVQERGAPESSLIQSMDEAAIPLKLWSGSALAAAWGQLFDEVSRGEDGVVRHRNQPLLTQAALSGQLRALGDGHFPDRRGSRIDVAPLIAIAASMWGLRTENYSAYERGGLTVV